MHDAWFVMRPMPDGFDAEIARFVVEADAREYVEFKVSQGWSRHELLVQRNERRS